MPEPQQDQDLQNFKTAFPHPGGDEGAWARAIIDRLKAERDRLRSLYEAATLTLTETQAKLIKAEHDRDRLRSLNDRIGGYLWANAGRVLSASLLRDLERALKGSTDA